MVVIFDHTEMHVDAERRYQQFNTAYYFLYKAKEKEGKELTDFEKGVVQMFAHSAFQIHPELREHKYPDLNKRLEELLEKGLLKLERNEISPFDSATSKYYVNNIMFKDFKKN